jgi:DNA modification methylase
MEINKIYKEPCLETLKRMPNDFLDSVITSPPYWQLRDYGYEGQWGLEPTYQEYLQHLWEMMDEIYRALKPTGTCWINLGDTYSKNKCLLLLPHQFAIGCMERGWILRNDIVWAKRNGMPESVNDRFSKKHEYFFFMVKSQDYYFDLDSVRDKIKDASLKRYEYSFSGNKGQVDRDMIGYVEGNKKHLIGDKLNDSLLNFEKLENQNTKYVSIEKEMLHRQGMHKNRGNNIVEKRPNLPNQNDFVEFLRERIKLNDLVNLVDIPRTKMEHWFRKDEIGFSFPSVEDWLIVREHFKIKDELFEKIDNQLSFVEFETDDIKKNSNKGKNCGDVADFWDIPTKGSSEKHYASYNDELLMKPILAGCPKDGLVYDPFMGSGTTAIMCLRADRKYIGSEMSDEYIKIAEKRILPFRQQQKLF